MLDYTQHITSNPNVMLGKPCIKGTRITVELILSKLGQGATTQLLIEDYPNLSPIQIQAAILYASDIVANEAFSPLDA
ncbi:MAG TPA: DUF433 domain-containing protein [Candidatus Kapabacteria bacterium]